MEIYSGKRWRLSRAAAGFAASEGAGVLHAERLVPQAQGSPSSPRPGRFARSRPVSVTRLGSSSTSADVGQVELVEHRVGAEGVRDEQKLVLVVGVLPRHTGERHVVLREVPSRRVAGELQLAGDEVLLDAHRHDSTDPGLAIVNAGPIGYPASPCPRRAVRGLPSSSICLCSCGLGCGHGAAEYATLDVRLGVVQILTASIPADYHSPWQTSNHERFSGSGVVLDGKRILTNAHVVADARFIQVQKEFDPQPLRGERRVRRTRVRPRHLAVKDPAFFAGIAAGSRRRRDAAAQERRDDLRLPHGRGPGLRDRGSGLTRADRPATCTA